MRPLSEIDHEAMARAIAIENKRQHKHEILRDGASQIDRKLQNEPCEEVGEFASYSCQMASLRLKAWEFPPCWLALNDTDPEHAHAVKLLRRLLDNNLSKYEPDPLGALAKVEPSTAA